MLLSHATWQDVEAYLRRSAGIILPTGSTEQHGPIGLIGTDTLCAEAIARTVGERVGALVAPSVCYTPAPFNLAFPGTISVSVETFARLVSDILDSLERHGFRHIYVLNGHGANIEPIEALARSRPILDIRVRSWWSFPAVDALRNKLYGDWEGMHATPSEVSITRALHRVVDHPDLPPPEKLSSAYIRDHAGDRHGPPDDHRARFPDGRVGSHSGLSSATDGDALLRLACEEAARDYLEFIDTP